MSDWKPIETANEETLRKHMLIVLMTKNRDFELCYVEDWAGQLVIVNDEGLPALREIEDITHWIPLPKPPTK